MLPQSAPPLRVAVPPSHRTATATAAAPPIAWPAAGHSVIGSWRPHWRKPAPGMLTAALTAAAVPPTAALFVGEKPEDRTAAEAAGVPFMAAADFFGRL